jgi:hypothetical protein
MSDFVVFLIGLTVVAWMVTILALLNACREHLAAMASQSAKANNPTARPSQNWQKQGSSPGSSHHRLTIIR